MAFNLFDAAGYFCLGAITGFGDWGVLLSAVPLWWKVGLALFGGSLYYGSMHAVASSGSVFLRGISSGPARGRHLTVAPNLAAGVVACAAAFMSPLGRSYVWVAAAASFGAGLGALMIIGQKPSCLPMCLQFLKGSPESHAIRFLNPVLSDLIGR